MEAETQLVKRRILLCGVLSMMAPAFGVAAAYLADVAFVRHAPPDAGFGLMARPRVSTNQAASLDAAMMLQFNIECHSRGESEYLR